MDTYAELVDSLARQIRKYPRGGGQRPTGMVILQRDKNGRTRKDWPKNSTVPVDVAKVLLGVKFHNRKAVASCFLASETVSRNLGLTLSWKDEFNLGGYLISCLIKAGYYELFNMLRSKYRFEYALQVKKGPVQALAEDDPYTSFEPFPPWKSAFDADGKRLVKPSSPQLKKTVWVPDDREFRRRKKKGEKEIHWSKEQTSLLNKKVGEFLLGAQIQGNVVVFQGDTTVIKPELDVRTWVKSVNKLERNAYRINQKLLNVVLQHEEMWPEPTQESFENKVRKLMRARTRRRSGKMWEPLSPEKRNYEYLADLESKQKGQDKKRKKQGLEPYPDGHKERYISDDQRDAHKEFWRPWYDNQEARQAVRQNYDDFIRVKKRAENIGDKPFYQRAFLDYRGRMYLNNSLVNYQGGDFSRGLIEFAEGKKLRKADWKHLWVHLANTYGIKGDSVTKEIGALSHKKKFLRWGKNPVKTFQDWSKEADDPWQCIRACIELVALDGSPNYESTLIAEIDQSTSCLQHIALLTGNEELAERVNLSDEYNDIYEELGDSMQELHDAEIKQKERRKIIKTALVPWTYGGNAFTACQAYHKSNIAFLLEMDASERMRFAHRVINHIEAELSAAVNFNTHVAEQLQQRFDGSNEANAIWGTPSEFNVYCYKQNVCERRVYVWYSANEKAGRPDQKRLIAWEPNNQTDFDKIKTAFAPNFVHSVDASVLHLLLANAPDDISYVTIHDAIGTHLRNISDAKNAFRQWMHTIYARAHPYLITFEGVPEPIAQPEPHFVSPEMLQQVKNGKHITG